MGTHRGGFRADSAAKPPLTAPRVLSLGQTQELAYIGYGEIESPHRPHLFPTCASTKTSRYPRMIDLTNHTGPPSTRSRVVEAKMIRDVLRKL